MKNLSIALLISNIFVSFICTIYYFCASVFCNVETQRIYYRYIVVKYICMARLDLMYAWLNCIIYENLYSCFPFCNLHNKFSVEAFEFWMSRLRYFLCGWSQFSLRALFKTKSIIFQGLMLFQLLIIMFKINLHLVSWTQIERCAAKLSNVSQRICEIFQLKMLHIWDKRVENKHSYLCNLLNASLQKPRPATQAQSTNSCRFSQHNSSKMLSFNLIVYCFEINMSLEEN